MIKVFDQTAGAKAEKVNRVAIKAFSVPHEVINVTAIRNEAKGGIPGDSLPSPWDIRAVNDSGSYYVQYSKDGGSVSINEINRQESIRYDLCCYGPTSEDHVNKECETLAEANREALEYMKKHV
jgi:hypothetical protein